MARMQQHDNLAGNKEQLLILKFYSQILKHYYYYYFAHDLCLSNLTHTSW